MHFTARVCACGSGLFVCATHILRDFIDHGYGSNYSLASTPVAYTLKLYSSHHRRLVAGYLLPLLPEWHVADQARRRPTVAVKHPMHDFPFLLRATELLAEGFVARVLDKA